MSTKGIRLPKLCSDDEFITDSVLGSLRITRFTDFNTNKLQYRLDWRESETVDMITAVMESKEPQWIDGSINHIRYLVKTGES